VALVVLLMFALFGAMFFMTFYLENVHGLDPVGAGVRLLPMTAMLIVGAPLAGAAITRVGPRIPIVAGMTLAAVALFGLSGLGATSSPNDTIVWFILLGLGLSPVMVGATDVIVGNELADVAGGLQSAAMQVGGTLGTAVLGAAPVTSDTAPQVARVITDISHATFASAMHTAFLVAAAVALAGALIGLLIRPGTGGGETAHAGI
jgi:predicted MFS family arabinose efflux permease